LKNRARLADLIGLSAPELRFLVAKADLLYKEFPVQKKTGGTRDVENPAKTLKKAQARIARWLSSIAPPDYLFCPVKGRCYVSNAAQHKDHRVVHCLDIRKYFPNTSNRRVYWFFNKVMKCSNDIAAILTKISTYKGHLPTGSPLSPIMAYFAHHDVWEAIAALCNQYGYTLTVYIDDVTVSGDKISPAVMWEIKKAIHRSGLRYHKEKSYFDRPAEITGVIVDGNRLVAPNRQYKKAKVIGDALRRAQREYDAKPLREKLTGLMGQMAQIATK
jgi:hypothetical protein